MAEAPFHINRIEFRNFRSYTYYSLEDIGNLTVFVGQNAIGKTNIIEGIGLVTALSSFRNAKTPELVKQGEDSCKVSARFVGEGRRIQVEMVVEEHRRKYLMNGKPKKTTDLKSLLPAVTFIPDDLHLIKGSSSVRRRAIDKLGSSPITINVG